MIDPLSAVSTRATPQKSQAKAGQILNHAKAYTFAVSQLNRVRRFLTLGTEGGTYYQGEHALTIENAQVTMEMAQTHPTQLVNEIVQISDAGRAPKNDQALFALAIAASSPDLAGRRYALEALPKVARTGTHLYQFMGYCEQFRGWGETLKRGVASWYLDQPVDKLAYQSIKYRQRDGWSHRDALRLSHPKTTDPARRALFDFLCGRDGSTEEAALPTLIGAYQQAQVTTDTREWVRLVTDYPITWEMLPDAALAEVQVWQAMIDKGMPATALMRQLPRLTNLGVFNSKETLNRVISDLSDMDRLRKGRVHPINILVAMRTYASGESLRGSSTWTPKTKIVDALDASFYASFGIVEPADKRTLVALDVSGSMSWATCGSTPLTPREASAAMALVTLATEPDTDVVAFSSGGGRASRFSSGITEINLSPRQRLDDALVKIDEIPMGGTDCSLPAKWATENGKEYDTIIIFTDNETYAGSSHPFQALEKYRQKVGLPVRQVVVGMTATECSIADPSDALSLDVAGFDGALPNIIAAFSRGDI